MTLDTAHPLGIDRTWRERARAVIPNGMYGHQSTRLMPEGFPQFLVRGQGGRIWDVDGNEYVDLMCSYGPIVLGHHHPAVDAAVREQQSLGDCQNGPSPVMVELSELFVETVDHADWAMMAKNGTDATTMCVTIARATTGQAQGDGRHRRVPRRRAVVHPRDERRGRRGPCPPRALHVQRRGVGPRRGRAVRGRPRRHRGVAVQARRPPRSGDGRSGLGADAAPGVRRHRRRADPRRRPLRIPPRLRRFVGDGRREARPVGVEQGDRQRSLAGGRAGQRPVPRRRLVDLHDRVVLVLGRVDGRRRGDDPSARGREGSRVDAAGRTAPPRRPGRPGSVTRARRSTRPARSRCRCSRSPADAEFERANRWSGTAAQHGAYLHPWHNWFICAAAHRRRTSTVALAATDIAFAAVRDEFGAD